MNTKLLRQKVLDLAIHGKLVPQNPEHEPASKLLERIRGESLPLATAGKPSSASPSPRGKAPKTPSAPISEDEIPFEIPENWCWCRLSDIAKIKTGSLDANAQCENGEYPFFTCGEEVFKTDTYAFDCSAVLLGGNNATGDFKMHICKGKFNAYQRVYVISPILYGELTEWCFLSIKNYLPKFKLDSIGSQTRYLKLGMISDMIIPLPPLEEQKLIVEEIERIFALIDTVEQNKTDLETVIKQTKSKILDLAIHGKLVPQDKADEPASKLVDRIKKEREKLIKNKIIKEERFFSAIEEKDPLPNNWTYVKIGDLTSVVTKQTGFDYSSTIKPNLSREKLDGMIPMVQTKNFSGKKFDLNTDYYIQKEIAQQFPKILLDSKCLLLSIVGASIGNIGVYSKTDLAMIGGAICKVKLLNEDLYDYLYYYLKSPTGQNLISKKIKSTAQGTITVQNVRELTIPLPPLNEQKRIVAKIEEIFTYLDSITKSIG